MKITQNKVLKMIKYDLNHQLEFINNEINQARLIYQKSHLRYQELTYDTLSKRIFNFSLGMSIKNCTRCSLV